MLWVVSFCHLLLSVCYVICLLHEGRLGADQCSQDTRPTAIVRKHKEKNTEINSSKCKDSKLCNLETSPIASSMPSEAAPASTRMEFSYRRLH